MKEVSPGRHVLQKSCAYSQFPPRARIPAKSHHPWPLSRGPLWQPAQRNSRKAPLSSMSGNLSLLRGHRLVPNSCNSCTSIPPTSSAFPHSPVLFLTFPGRRQTPPGVISVTHTEAHLFVGRYRPSEVSASLRPVSCLAPWIIVVRALDGTCSLSHNAKRGAH